MSRFLLLSAVVLLVLLPLPAVCFRLRDVFKSFLQPLLISCVSAFLIMNFILLWYVMNAKTVLGFMNVWTLFATAGASLLIGMLFFLPYAAGLRREMGTMVSVLSSLIEGERSRLHGKMQVLSTDEVGQLAAVFNRLQDKIKGRHEKMERELQFACTIQQKLLPEKQQTFGEFEIAAHIAPSREVGGDFFDVIRLGDGKIAVAIGDVSGKGMPAASIMSAMMVLLRAEIPRGSTPADTVGRLNEIIAQTLKEAGVVTFGLAVVDIATGRIDYVSAGHMAPYIFGRSELREVFCSSLPLGAAPDAVYHETELKLEPGECLLLYTDGIVEAMEPSGSIFGFERFEHLLRELPHEESADIQLKALIDRIPTAVANKYDDDRTVMLIRRSADNAAKAQGGGGL